MTGDSPPVFPTAEHVFVEPKRFRLMRFGLPAGLTLNVLLIAFLLQGIDLSVVAFLTLLLLLIAQASAGAMLSASSVHLAAEGPRARIILGEVRIQWERIQKLELVDRGNLAFPRRLLRVQGDRREFYAFDSIAGFDVMLDSLRRASGLDVATMPVWKRFILLQWGV